MKIKKLFASLGVLALTICSLAFGVWASVTASFTASGTISFSALNTNCLFDITVVGMKPADATEEATQTSASGYKATRVLKYTSGTASGDYLALSTKENSTDKYAPLDLEFDELNTNIQDDTLRNTITVSILVTNNSGFAVAVTLSSTYTTATNNLLATLGTAQAAIANGQTGTVNLTLTPNDLTQSISLSNIDIFNINVEPTTIYSVTPSLTNCTSSNTSSQVTAGSSYTTTLSPSSGHALPNEVLVSVGGQTLTVGTDYEYDSSTGVLTITSAKITGNISITATAPAVYTINSPTLPHVTTDSGNATTITAGTEVVLTFTADSGYELPDSVTVTGATSSWNKSTGELTLSNPTGDVTITINAVEIVSGYTITISTKSGCQEVYGELAYYSLDNGATWINLYNVSVITEVTQIKFYLNYVTNGSLGPTPLSNVNSAPNQEPQFGGPVAPGDNIEPEDPNPYANCSINVYLSSTTLNISYSSNYATPTFVITDNIVLTSDVSDLYIGVVVN